MPKPVGEHAEHAGRQLVLDLVSDLDELAEGKNLMAMPPPLVRAFDLLIDEGARWRPFDNFREPPHGKPEWRHLVPHPGATSQLLGALDHTEPHPWRREPGEIRRVRKDGD